MIFKYLRPIDWLLMAVTAVFVFLQVYLELEIPGYMTKITMLLQTGGTVEQVMEEGAKMLLCTLGAVVLMFVTSATAAYIGSNLGKTLRKKQFDQVEKYSEREINKFSLYSLITRSTNDVTQVQLAFTMGLVVCLKAPIMAVWALFKISVKNFSWISATIGALIAILLIIAVFLLYVFPRFKKVQGMTDSVNRVTKEGVNGIRVIHAYNAESYQEQKFDVANMDLTGVNLSVNRSMAFLFPGIMLVMNVLNLGIYWIGAYIIHDTSGIQSKMAEFSDMVVFSSYAMMVILAFIMLVIILMLLPRAMVASRRIQEVIDTEPSIVDGNVTETDPEKAGTVSFENVSFKYSDSIGYVLKDISFDVKKGDVVAIIGATGSGKSTMMSLLLRFYDATEGRITVDGVDIKDYRMDVLYDKIGYVPQKAMMFKGTISSNVNYGGTMNDRDEEDVKKAVNIAQSTDFVEKMEGQYEGAVSEGGINLSGGQKQRISIARAVCKKPEIYIFDDTFSALDYKTDQTLRSRLKTETAGVTTFIVAQRIGTIKDADTIIVLEDGEIAGIGKHHELLDRCDVYREIALSQLTEEELVR